MEKETQSLEEQVANCRSTGSERENQLYVNHLLINLYIATHSKYFVEIIQLH